MLIDKGLKGEFNAPIAKMLLGKRGYADVQDITGGGMPIKGVDITVRR